MKAFGKLQSCQCAGNVITVTCEQGQLEVTVLTERIIRVFSQLGSERPQSKAIEGNKSKEVPFTVDRKDDCVQIETSELVVKICDDAKVDIYDKNGRALCRDYRGERTFLNKFDLETAELMEKEGHVSGGAEGNHAVQVLKAMDGEEAFYGLGDKTGFLNKRGYEYMCWNTDNPDPQVDCFKALYKSIPFFITLKKDAVYGLFFDNTFRSFFDMAKESEEYFWFGADQGNLDYYFIGGETMKEVLQGYTYLTGTAPLPQLWTLGYHQSRWGYKNEKDVRRIAQTMREYKIPCDAIHLDIDYMERYKVFTIDPGKFSDFHALTEEVGDMGIRIVTIMDPGVKVEKDYEIYETGIRESYFAKSPDGTVYENEVWPGDSVYPDFGRKEVRDWWGENYKALMDAGVSGIWTDMNEPASFRGELPDDVVFYDEDRKSTHAEQHNLYGHNMARATYHGLKKLTGKRPFVITRACYSGSQKYTIGWTGDNHSMWGHLQMAIPQLCNLGLSGMPIVGTDIGGFSSDTTPELLCRWIELGCLSPFCRNHASTGTRAQEPWVFGEKTVNIYRKYLNLRYSLLPYLYDLFKQEEEQGMPIMRPLVLEYEKDENVRNLNGQFMVGESLLVAPVVEPGMTQKIVYLPKGDWYDYWTREKIEGGRFILREAEIDECPIYVKAGSILPMYTPRLSTSEEKDEELILDVYPGDGVVQYVHYQDNGEDFAYQNGAYNLYKFILEGRIVKVEMLHMGYEKEYQKITTTDKEILVTR